MLHAPCSNLNNKKLLFRYSTGKLLNLSEIRRFAWVFGWCCVVWRQVTIEKMPQLWFWWSLFSRQGVKVFHSCKKQLGSTSHELSQGPRLVTNMKHSHTYLSGWSICIHVLSANLSSLVDLWRLAITGTFVLIQDSTNKFRKQWIVWVPESRIYLKFLWLLILKDLQENFCVLREDKWRYSGETGM